jgi:antitoxin VapB
MAEAKLFTHGGSQAVRLPKAFRFEGTHVHVRRVGDEVVLSSRAPMDIQTLIKSLDDFEPSFKMAREQPLSQERAAISPKG